MDIFLVLQYLEIKNITTITDPCFYQVIETQVKV